MHPCLNHSLLSRICNARRNSTTEDSLALRYRADGGALACLLAFIPWLFTWSGLIVAILGHLVFGMFGITIGYHRLLTHRGFTCPKWLEHTLAIMGMFNLQDSPARWVAIHRAHHRNCDEQMDPHSPAGQFFLGHMGWVVCRHEDLHRTLRYAKVRA